MNTNKLKRFAQDARRKLLEQVASRMELILNTDSAELREKAAALSNLKEEINRSSKKQVIDKVAYTWFNRFMALRFMDANDYQPIGVRVVSPKDGFTLPEILEDARQGQIPDELPVKRQHIYDLLDGKIPSSNVQNEVYKELLIGACNHLHKTFPFLFEKINDYTELLLPDDLTSEFSVVNDFIEGMQKEDCEEVEVIGWLYQFYISERKDEVFASKSKVKKEDIPAATQLFTPRWIVEYMVQNTVGKLWLQNNPKSQLREHMPYFIESPSVTADEYLKVESVEEITLLDQACGSGHILVYGFELFSKIYEEQGYSPSEIPQLIIEKNLYGFEIDERAAQLAGMALMMKARAYHRRIFKKEISPNILCFEDVVFSQTEFQEVLVKTFLDKSREFQNDLKLLENTTNFGSLIIPESTPEFLQKAFVQVQEKLKSADVFEQHLFLKLKAAVNELLPLSRKYTCVVDNPPYMGGGAMNAELSAFVRRNYPDSKADLMACFMEAGLIALKPKGFLGMINQHSWMFLGTFESLRENLIKKTFFDTLLHLGARTFPEIGGEVVQNASFTFWNNKFKAKGIYIRLIHFGTSDLKNLKTQQALESQDCDWLYRASQSGYEKVPGKPIGYWLTEKAVQAFEYEKIDSIGTSSPGIRTGKDERFIRFWMECKNDQIGFKGKDSSYLKKDKKWFPITRGGQFRKWFGNNWYVVLGENQFQSVKEFCHDHRLRDSIYYFKKGITWTMISTKSGFRICPEGVLFGNGGPVLYTEEIYSILGFLNSKVSNEFLKLLNPTLNITKTDVEKLPLLPGNNLKKNIVEEAIDISKMDWNSREISWGFLQNEIVKRNGQSIEDSYIMYMRFWRNKFSELYNIEEEINLHFIEVYNLQDELNSFFPLEEITIQQEESRIEKGELVFNQKEIFAQFMSYAVGCMFGRYSLDKEGLILANQGETLEDYFQKVYATQAPHSGDGGLFVPDEDNIIPVLDDEYFEDDIVNRFYEFLKASLGQENFDKNLAFVEECLGKDVRKYFVKDFYKDHIKRYKKRPIYWMFSSPKGSFNVLIYMHRYTPNTLNQILNGYLLEYREKLKSRIEHLDHIIETGSSTEQTKAGKEKDKIKIVLLELQEYERKILYPLATERIAIDLDDGVLVNYNKFGKAIQEVPGLNDKKAKKKVREFDWVDTETII